jgi:hypothetical protein
VYYDISFRVPVGVAVGLGLCVGLMVTGSVGLFCLAGPALRSGASRGRAFLRSLELGVPTLVFLKYSFLLAQRGLLFGMLPEHPWCYLTLLGLSAAVVVGARRGWGRPARLALLASWLAFYLVTNALAEPFREPCRGPYGVGRGRPPWRPGYPTEPATRNPNPLDSGDPQNWKITSVNSDSSGSTRSSRLL